MIRESLDPGSKYASVVVRAAGSTTPPEGAELRVRDAVGYEIARHYFARLQDAQLDQTREIRKHVQVVDLD